MKRSEQYISRSTALVGTHMQAPEAPTGREGGPAIFILYPKPLKSQTELIDFLIKGSEGDPLN